MSCRAEKRTWRFRGVVDGPVREKPGAGMGEQWERVRLVETQEPGVKASVKSKTNIAHDSFEVIILQIQIQNSGEPTKGLELISHRSVQFNVFHSAAHLTLGAEVRGQRCQMAAPLQQASAIRLRLRESARAARAALVADVTARSWPNPRVRGGARVKDSTEATGKP